MRTFLIGFALLAIAIIAFVIFALPLLDVIERYWISQAGG